MIAFTSMKLVCCRVVVSGEVEDFYQGNRASRGKRGSRRLTTYTDNGPPRLPSKT